MTRWKNTMKLALLSMVGLGFAGCESLTAVDCNGVGCLSAVELQIVEPASGSFQIEVYSAPEAERKVIECSTAAASSEPITIEDFAPTTVYIDVISAAGRRTFQINPNYESVRQTDDQCSPICLYAELEITTAGVRQV